MKAHRQIQPKTASREISNPGEVISADICGPVTPTTPGGAKYTSVIIEHYTSVADVKLLKKTECGNVLEHFQEFIPRFERQSGHPIKEVRTDNGREYTSNIFVVYL